MQIAVAQADNMHFLSVKHIARRHNFFGYTPVITNEGGAKSVTSGNFEAACDPTKISNTLGTFSSYEFLRILIKIYSYEYVYVARVFLLVAGFDRIKSQR